MRKASQETVLKIEQTLSQTRVNRFEIESVVATVLNDSSLFPFLHKMTEAEDEHLSWHALWACEHLCRIDNSLFIPLRERIISQVLNSTNEGKRRLWLNILLFLPDDENISIPLLNYCMDNMLSPQKPAAVQAACMKLAHRLCMQETELLPELKIILENVELEFYTPAIKSTIQKILHTSNSKKRGKQKINF